MTIKKPIGLTNIIKTIDKIVEDVDIYHHGGIIPSFIINLDQGEGQTTVTEYITSSLQTYNVRNFGGLDTYLEFILDGSLDQMKEVFNTIDQSSVYTNNFEGVISFDVSKLADFVREYQTTYFLNELKKRSKFATCIFFVPSKGNDKIRELIEKIEDSINKENINFLKIKPYSYIEYTKIIESMILDNGIELVDEITTYNTLLQLVHEKQISTMKQARSLFQLLVRHADYNDYIPRLSASNIKNILKKSNIETKNTRKEQTR